MVPGSARNWIAVNAAQQSSLNKKNKNKNMATLQLRKSIGRSPWRRGLLFIPLLLGCFGLLAAPNAFGVNPPPPRGYPNFTTAAGDHALQALTLGLGNTAIGTFSLFSVTTGNFNTALGAGALDLNTADSNTAVGTAALLFNTIGTENTANGTAALEFNDSGSFNTASGAFALFNNIDGQSNNAFGESALFNNVHASQNTAIGDVALAFNDVSLAGTGNANVAVGNEALFANDSGSDNDAVGFAALFGNITGFQNVAMGSFALGTPTSGTASFNTALGFAAEQNDDGIFNTVVGYSSGQNLTAGFENIYIGDSIGLFGGVSATEVNTLRIGDLSGFNGITQTFVGGIANTPQVWNGVTVCQVTVNGSGQLGVDCVNPSNPGSTPQGGPSAPVRPGAPQPRSAPGAPAQRPTMRQAMLNDKVEKLQATVAQQQKQIETLTARLREQAETFTAQLKEQAAQIQKVSAQLETSKPAPQVVNNP